MSQTALPPRTLAVALLIAVLACAPKLGELRLPSDRSSTTLEVRNDRWDDLTVYLDRGGVLLKLGTVPGLSTKVLRVPEAYLSPDGGMVLKAKRPGSGVLATSVPFNLARGQRVEWIAARTSGLTGVAVR